MTGTAMTATHDIRVLVPGDADRVAALLARAFQDDPVSVWIWPDPRVRQRAMAESVGAYGGRALALGTGFVAGDFAAVALWLPPGETLDAPEFEELLARTVAGPESSAYLEQAERLARNRPHGPHWYLPLIGVDPAHQGGGHGTALLRHGLALADRDRLPVYLESSSPANLGLYRRHGFDVLEEVRVGYAPPKFSLMRAAR